MAMLKVSVALASAASSMVTLPTENVPGAIGVPAKAMLLPRMTAVNPVGKPLNPVTGTDRSRRDRQRADEARLILRPLCHGQAADGHGDIDGDAECLCERGVGLRRR